MEKYHKNLGFPNERIAEAQNLILRLQNRKIRFSNHAIHELLKENEAEKIGLFLANYILNYADVFELAIENNRIEKLGFRIKYTEKDIVFVLSREKLVITAWLNSENDLHYTLKKEKYSLVNR